MKTIHRRVVLAGITVFYHLPSRTRRIAGRTQRTRGRRQRNVDAIPWGSKRTAACCARAARRSWSRTQLSRLRALCQRARSGRNRRLPRSLLHSRLGSRPRDFRIPTNPRRRPRDRRPNGRASANRAEGRLLRVATVDDAAFISRTVMSSWQDAYRNFLSWSFLASLDQNSHHDRQAWVSRIREPGSMTWIISNSRDDVGVLRIVTDVSSIPGTDSQLTTLYLLLQSRGHGLCSEALAFARAEASRRARPILGVCVLEGNRRGQRFYEQRGAQRIGERISFRLDEQPIIDILYRFDPIVRQSAT
jgi:hypothetical protein